MNDSPIDQLTGVSSYRALRLAVVTERPAVFIDIDGLIWLNDQAGHEVGDRALVQVASVLTSLVPAQVFRIGGDEFWVVPTDATVEIACTVARRAVASVRALEIPYTRTDQPSRSYLEVNAVVFTLNAGLVSRGISATGITDELRSWFHRHVKDAKAGDLAGAVADAHEKSWPEC